MEVKSITHAIIGTILMAGGSYVYGNVAQVSSLHTGLIIVIANTVDSIFYLIAQQNTKESDKLAAYIFTRQIMIGIGMTTLRYFKIITNLDVCLLAGLALCDYYGRICELQKRLDADLRKAR